MKTLKVPLREAEKAKQYLLKNNLYDKEHLLLREKEHLYFPLAKLFRLPPFLKGAIVEKALETLKPRTLSGLLEKELTPKERALLPSSFDVIGDILIIDLSKELEKKEKLIASALLQLYHNIKVVTKKADIHSGIYRTRKIALLAGEKRKETIHTENGIRLKLDVEKVYFSPRTSQERSRVAQQVKPKEKVLVMFSGCGPYTFNILKLQPQVEKIVSIEINPEAVKCQKENLHLNNFSPEKIEIYQGEVRKVLSQSKETFHRILMPLPKDSVNFLDLAVKHLKRPGRIHLYEFWREDELEKRKKELKELIKKEKRTVKSISAVKCGEYKPRVFRICFDILVR